MGVFLLILCSLSLDGKISGGTNCFIDLQFCLFTDLLSATHRKPFHIIVMLLLLWARTHRHKYPQPKYRATPVIALSSLELQRLNWGEVRLLLGCKHGFRLSFTTGDIFPYTQFYSERFVLPAALCDKLHCATRKEKPF